MLANTVQQGASHPVASRALAHQEDDTSLGVTWRDLAQLGVLARIGRLGIFAKTCQLTQVFDAVHHVPPSRLPSPRQLQCRVNYT